MRKLLMITAGFVLALGLISCEKQDKNSDSFPGQAGVKATSQVVTVPMASVPEVSGAVGPYIIPPLGKDKGGNRSCEDAKAAWNVIFPDADPILGDCDDCGTKMDIGDDYVGDVDGFPFHVWVNDDGSIGFSIGEGDLDCEVQAVIVKGSNQANVYYFPDGTLGADGLAAPAFDPQVPSRFPWVSNLTFCYTCEPPDEEPEFIISLKTGIRVYDSGGAVVAQSYAYTAGDYPVPEDNGTPIPIGYHWLGFGENFTLTLKQADGGGDAGTLVATEVDVAGVPHIQVVVTITDASWTVWSPWLYIGSEAGISALNYELYPFDDEDATIVGNVATFLIPVADITL